MKLLTTSMLKLEGETLMKKSLIALAVAGAMTAPMVAQADATIFGEWVGVMENADEGDLNIYHDTIELGVKGTVDNDIDGLETGFKLLMEGGGTATIDDDLKKMFGYMEGDFGTVTIGKSDNAADIISDTGLNGGAFTPNSGRKDASAKYETPDLGGFMAAFGFTADGSEATDDLASTQFMVGYEAAGFGAAVSYDETDGTEEITALNVTYEMDAISVFGSWWSDDESEDDGYSLGGEFGTGSATIYAEYDKMSDESADTDPSLTLVGVQYNLGSDAWVGVEYNAYNSDAEDAGNNDTLAAYYGLAW